VISVYICLYDQTVTCERNDVGIFLIALMFCFACQLFVGFFLNISFGMTN